HPSASYFYVGYMLDRNGDEDPTGTLDSVTGPEQFALFLTEVMSEYGGSPGGLNPITDHDPATDDIFDDDVEVPSGTGNGGSGMIQRFREGIERFLITDINNPAASATAQSELAIMWDHI